MKPPVEASDLVEQLSEAGVDVDAALLFGSHARGSAGPASDVDVLLVSQERLSTRRLRIAGVVPEAVSITTHTWDSLRELVGKDWSFTEHLRREGTPLAGDVDRLKLALEQPPADGARDAFFLRAFDELDRLRDAGPLDGDPSRIRARTFGLVKRVCMFANAEDGVFEFDRVRSIVAFSEISEAAMSDPQLFLVCENDFLAAQGRRTAEDGHGVPGTDALLEGARRVLDHARG